MVSLCLLSLFFAVLLFLSCARTRAFSIGEWFGGVDVWRALPIKHMNTPLSLFSSHTQRPFLKARVDVTQYHNKATDRLFSRPAWKREMSKKELVIGAITHLTLLPFFSKWRKQNVDLGCGLISDPGTLGAGAKTRLKSRIQEFTPHCVCR